ncbi:VCBS repeat-containing protein [Arsenicibacter rosenii]|uniref:RNA-binding protein n=1 Tax=Arsenicibacter rosenii TaxID=1750698 RepID=A0A1S2VHY3_9BACT|nr:VCBS repeat-containing protein [Arsenicibacter rosenii]OIN58367.1 RNA-binding protein [Arsenicibacter rosenii]
MLQRVLLVATAVAMVGWLSTACQQQSDTLFTLVSADKTGITFSNRITDNDSMNILDFEYIYNGGGTAIGDFNNDGLQDVFFSGNQVANKLYINQGELKFEDITTKAGVGGNGKWCSGVALVDINNDGWLDIYVGATVFKDPEKRQNLLYVNQGGTKGGTPVFKEMAKEYGIADDGHTTNAAFFDYDNDGDLDLYVLTNTIEQYPNAYRPKITNGTSPTTDRLYRNLSVERLANASLNAKPLFENVSKQAGIQIEGYGLGINICDINRDGWKDVYVTNDYLSDDLMYINNQDGTFTDQRQTYLKHTSNSAMGNDVADINNDGLADIVAVDMLPRDNYRKKMLMGPSSYQVYLNNEEYNFGYQYVRNTLQLNMGNRPAQGKSKKGAPVFSEISLFSDVAETDWSWSPLLIDFDHDGNRDLVVTNGFPKDITDRDFISFRANSSSVSTKEYMLSQIPVVKISNYAFKNNGDLTFSDVTEKWGLKQPSFSNGAAYGDLDNDGDLDYVVNNINDSAFVYRNNLVERKADNANYLRMQFAGPAQNRMGLGAIVELYYHDPKTNEARKQVYEHSPYRGYLSTVEPSAHFGLGNVQTIDEVRVIWPTRNGEVKQTLRNVKVNQTLTVNSKDATENVVPEPDAKPLFTEVTDSLGINFTHQEPEYIDYNVQKLLPHKLSQFAPAVAVGDVNGDGLDDFFVSGSRFHQGTFFIQTANGKFTGKPLFPATARAQTGALQPITLSSLRDPSPNPEKQSEDMGTLLLDVDQDGDVDLYIASGGIEGNAGTEVYMDRLYLNDGKGNFTLAVNALPPVFSSKSCVKATDFDRDGDLDLFVGGRVEPDHYPKPVSSLILRNDSKAGQVKFTDVTAQVAPNLKDIGLVCDALWTDVDNDGWQDLFLAGEWMPLTLLKNQQGKLVKAEDKTLSAKKGWWNSLVSGDFDHDGDVDYIAGNLGLNARMRASDAQPARLYAADFDNNGFYDAIPTIYIPDESGKMQEYTFHGREDLIKQMIAMRARFPYYKDFTTATIDKLLKPEEREKALVLEANYFQSSYLENKGDGTFAIRPLPALAQLAPIFGMVASDVDRDGNLDVMLVGNDYSGEVLMGRYDGLNGLWLKGDGKGGFAPQSLAASGFFVPANAKGLAQLSDAKGHELLVASQNRGRLCVFKDQKPARILRLRPTDASAIITYANGRKEKVEFPYGQSFLSQSGRILTLSPQAKRVDVIDSQGKKRQIQ